uniref:Uncharacterized protein n=1 Tax=Anguilla anguilla TaxID=7936 RepID=A0A0E9PW25_ANGAN
MSRRERYSLQLQSICILCSNSKCFDFSVFQSLGRTSNVIARPTSTENN